MDGNRHAGNEEHVRRTRTTLRQLHAINERQYKGDYGAVVILCDLAEAVERAGLTARQSEAIALVYGEDLTQGEAAKRMGVTQQVVEITARRAVDNIAKVYEEWARLDGDIDDNTDAGETMA